MLSPFYLVLRESITLLWEPKVMFNWFNSLMDKWLTNIITERLKSIAPPEIDYEKFAQAVGGCDYSKIAEHLDVKEIANAVDITTIAAQVSDNFDLNDVAQEIAGNIDLQDLASYIDVDTSDLELDYTEFDINYEELGLVLVSIAAKK